MSVKPIFPVKVSITIDIMLNFDGDFDGQGAGDGTCKQTFSSMHVYSTKRQEISKYRDANAKFQCKYYQY